MPKLGLDEQKSDIRPEAPGNAAIDADAQWSRGGATVNPARPEGKDQDLTWEVSRPVGANPTTASATASEGASEGAGEVSRGRSRSGLAARSIETLARKGRNGLGSQGRTAGVKGRIR